MRKSTPFVFALLTVAACGGIPLPAPSPAAPTNEGPKPTDAERISAKLNPLQQKYWEVSSLSNGAWCVPKGTLKALHQEPYGCFKNRETCPFYTELFEGRAAPETQALVRDGLKLGSFTTGVGILMTPTFEFMCGFTTQAGIDLTPTLIRAAGYSSTREDATQLEQLLLQGDSTDEALFNEAATAYFFSASPEALASTAVALFKPAHKNRSVAAARENLVMRAGELRRKELVPSCAQALSEARDKSLMAACVNYLGHVGDSSNLEALGRMIGEQPKSTARALGHMSGADRTVIARVMPKRGHGRFAALVALTNLGDSEAWEELQARAKGYDSVEDLAAYTSPKPTPKPKEAGKPVKGVKPAKVPVPEKATVKTPDASKLIAMARQTAAVAPELVFLTDPDKRKTSRELLTTFTVGTTPEDLARFVWSRLAAAQLGDDSAGPALLAALASADPKLRREILEALVGPTHGHELERREGAGFLPNSAEALAVFAKKETDLHLRSVALQGAAWSRAMARGDAAR